MYQYCAWLTKQQNTIRYLAEWSIRLQSILNLTYFFVLLNSKMWRYQKGKQKLLMEGQTIQWRTRKMTKGQAMIFKTLHIYNEDWATRTPLKTFKIIINITICIRCGVQPIDRRIVLFLSRWFWININKIMKTFIDICNTSTKTEN
jgi:hypothetical protein